MSLIQSPKYRILVICDKLFKFQYFDPVLVLLEIMNTRFPVMSIGNHMEILCVTITLFNELGYNLG